MVFKISDNRQKGIRYGGTMKGKGNYGLIIVLFMFLIVSLISCSGGGGGSSSSSATPPLPTYTQKFLYVANHDSGDVYAFSIADDGTLAPVGDPITAGGFPESVTADPLGRFVYVANWGGTINAYTIETTGALTDVAGSPFTAGSIPESATVDPSGSFLYVANRESHNVSAYTIGTNGALIPLAGSPFATEPLAYPETVTADPLGRFAYVANWFSGTISAYIIGADGALTPVTGSPFEAGSNPYSVTVDPSGSFVYVANYGDGIVASNVSAYSIESNGALTPVAGSPFTAGTGPVSITTIGII